jgi:hypothetical protein
VWTPKIFDRLAGAGRILIAGAGGGFDVYAGLPLGLALGEAGHHVVYANLSFVELNLLDLDVWAAPNVAAVSPFTKGSDGYFPERALATWLAAHGYRNPVYAFPKLGVQPLRSAYRSVVERERIDAIVLVDGGTDILMRGDESGLGTPEEDMTSLAAVAGLGEIDRRLVACLGFGIDSYHGVNHVQVLENIADLDRDGAYLGAFSIPGDSAAARQYVDAVAHAQSATPTRPSIVNGQIAAAVSGRHGDVRFTRRTADTALFVNPLMSMYFTFDLDGLARRNLYLDRLESTVGIMQVARRIEEFRNEVATRTPRMFPH